MNEAQAGAGGFIKVQGDSFVHEGTGEPIRFWAVNVRPRALRYDRPGIERLARFVAKLGVNMVRFQGPLWKDDDITRIDPAKLDRLHMLAAALRRQGIYLSLSTYFPLWLRPKDGPGFEGYDGHQVPFGLPFFSPAFQTLQRSWFRAVLTAKNPYTGVSLAEDPTLAFVEILNEDSLFFWTFDPYRSVPAPQMRLLETSFGEWLKQRYGGLAQALARWSGGHIKGDDAATGRAGLMPLAEIRRRRDLRAQDTATFLAEVQRTYFDRMLGFLKHDLAFKGSVTGSNWVTADARTLGPLDKWSNAGCDYMDRHGYFGGPHEGDRASYLISPGDRYDDALALRFESGKPGDPLFSLPIMDLAYDGKPSTLSEVGWLPPNRYRADMPILAAAYGALQGSNALVFFTVDDDGWAPQIQKFTIADPAAMGQFPAAALMYRKGLVKTADPVVHLDVSLASLEALEGLPIAAPENLDALRAAGVPNASQADLTPGAAMARRIDPLAFLVGRVEVQIGERPGEQSTFADLSGLIDRHAKKVRSATGELGWDWGRGVATVDAPAAQGATGLLQAAGAITLHDVTIASDNEYGSVMLVSLDGAPLARSRKILLQAVSEDANSGWSAPGSGLRAIADVGGPPIVVRKLAGRVTFHRPDAQALAVTPLDFNGYPAPGRLALTAAGELTLLPTTLYYLIEKP